MGNEQEVRLVLLYQMFGGKFHKFKVHPQILGKAKILNTCCPYKFIDHFEFKNGGIFELARDIRYVQLFLRLNATFFAPLL